MIRPTSPVSTPDMKRSIHIGIANSPAPALFPKETFPHAYACPACRVTAEHPFDESRECFRCSTCGIPFAVDELKTPYELLEERRPKPLPVRVDAEQQQAFDIHRQEQIQRLAESMESTSIHSEISSVAPAPTVAVVSQSSGMRPSDSMRATWLAIRNGEFKGTSGWRVRREVRDCVTNSRSGTSHSLK